MAASSALLPCDRSSSRSDASGILFFGLRSPDLMAKARDAANGYRVDRR
jgi:hypothetical protein